MSLISDGDYDGIEDDDDYNDNDDYDDNELAQKESYICAFRVYEDPNVLNSLFKQHFLQPSALILNTEFFENFKLSSLFSLSCHSFCVYSSFNCYINVFSPSNCSQYSVSNTVFE